MVIDHVVMLVSDGVRAAAQFRDRDGLGSERGMYYPRAGTRHYSIPLDPPAVLEFLEIEDRTSQNRPWTAAVCWRARPPDMAYSCGRSSSMTSMRLLGDWVWKSSITQSRTATEPGADGAQSMGQRICRSLSTIPTTETARRG
jgi:hypothetical protein